MLSFDQVIFMLMSVRVTNAVSLCVSEYGFCFKFNAGFPHFRKIVGKKLGMQGSSPMKKFVIFCGLTF